MSNSIEDLKAGQHFVTVMCGMAGYFACDMWMNGEAVPGSVFPEPWDSYPGRFKTYAEAKAVGEDMAEVLGMPFFEGRDKGDLVATGETLGEALARELGCEVVSIEIGGSSNGKS